MRAPMSGLTFTSYLKSRQERREGGKESGWVSRWEGVGVAGRIAVL